MSKELEALKQIKKYYPFKVNELEYQNIIIIETALKDYEEIINTGWKNIPTNLQFLGKILDKYLPNSDTLKDLEKSLKALEIIKNKNVDIQTLKRTNNVVEYNSYVAKGLGEKELTKEEYDILKEALL